MVKPKKPFIDKKKATTYQLIHRSQRDVAPDRDDADPTGASSNHRMILWPQQHSATTPPSHDLTTATTQSNDIATWKNQLAAMGVLDETDHEQFLRPITGTGVFLDASTGRPAAPPHSVVLEEATVEVNRQMDSLPLTADCMDDDVAMALFGDYDENEYEELTDDFVMFAAGVAAYDNPVDDGSSTQQSAPSSFDFDAHIQQLINTAKLGRSNDNKNVRNEDQDYFENHWRQPLRHAEMDDEDLDSEGGNGTGRRRDYEYGSTTMSVTTEPGVVAKLNPDEERALCEKFEATLAAYDESSNDDDEDHDDFDQCVDDVEALGMTEPHEKSRSFISLSLVGDSVIEAALDEYLTERDDEIFMHGTVNRGRSGGSGFAILVGTHMINAKELDATTSGLPQAYPEQEPVVPLDEYIAEAELTLAQPKEKPPAEEIFMDGKSYYTERERNPWDCESILSTYSNLDNNPVTINQTASRRLRRQPNAPIKDCIVASVENEYRDLTDQHIRLSTKTGLPIVAPKQRFGLSEHCQDDVDFDDTIVSVNKGVGRSKDETPEEKRARKLLVKRERELARLQKKITRQIFSEEFQKYAAVVGDDPVAGKTVFRFS
jgi:protein LTV1